MIATNQTVATVNDLENMADLLIIISNNQFLLSIAITILATIVVGLSLGLLFRKITNKDHDERQNIVRDHRKRVQKFIISKISIIQDVLDKHQQNADALNVGKAPEEVSQKMWDIGIWRDVFKTNYADIRFVFLSNLMEMPLDVDIDELDLIFHNPLKDMQIVSNGITNTDIDESLNALKDFAKKFD